MARVFILNDSQNLFHRQVNACNPALGLDNMIGMALHMVLYSLKKEWTTFSGTHAVCFLEGSSWRKKVYTEYKADRQLKHAAKTEREKEDHRALQEAFDALIEFIQNKTNISVIRNPKAEADDMVAIFVEAHPDDTHILISSDSDFYQLLRNPNLTIYDPVKDILIKQDGVYDDNGKKLEFTVTSNARIKTGPPNPNFVCDPDWYNYALFLKCVRGDSTDNIFSAYPGIREKGTKTKVGIREAYMDKAKGYAWNNFVNQVWTDHNGETQQVKECLERNKLLIDLSQIPDDIKTECLIAIAEQTSKPEVVAGNIGPAFMKFCGLHNLPKIANNAKDFMPMLKSKYQ